MISIPSPFWLISVRKSPEYTQHEVQHWHGASENSLISQARGVSRHWSPPGIHPTAPRTGDGALQWIPRQGPEIPQCHRPLPHWAETREPASQKFTFLPKLLVEGNLSQEPVCSRNKFPFKAGKSQAESVRYPNVALS